jgi:hypothetical protein
MTPSNRFGNSSDHPSEVVVFYPYVFSSSNHGWHGRAIHVLRELANDHILTIAAIEMESGLDTSEENLQRAADLLCAESVSLYSQAPRTKLHRWLKQLITRLAVTRLIRRSSQLERWVHALNHRLEQRAQRLWFHRLVRMHTARLVVVFFAGWEYLLDGLEARIPRALELHDLIPIGHYLQDALLPSVMELDGYASLTGIDSHLGYIYAKSQLPPPVRSEVEGIARSIRGCYDSIWMICDRESNLLHQFERSLPIEVMPPSYPAIVVRDEQPETSRSPLLPLGPNIFNLYSILKFIGSVLPAVDPPGSQKIQLTGRVWADLAIPESTLIENLGMVADFSHILSNSLFMIAPTRIGTGQQTKIFEALAAAIPVVTYKEAIPSDMDDPSIGILAATDEGELAAFINMLWNNPADLAELRHGALQGQDMVAKPSGYGVSAMKLIDGRWGS